MSTIYEVSKLAGVSIATVSRVLNNNKIVNEKTRRNVLDVIEQLNYRPNASAKSLASQITDSVGILVPEFHGPFYGCLMGSIEKTLRAKNKYALVASGQSSEEIEKKSIEFLISRNCDALVLHVEALSNEYLIELSKKSTPFVLINRYIEEISHHCIYLDNEHGGYIMAKYLLEQGHRNFAYISGPLQKSDSKGRYLGVQRALLEYDISLNESLFYQGNFHQECGSKAMKKFINSNVGFTAVICANDQMAIGALLVAHEKGIDIPRDVSFIGFDNSILAQYSYPELSSIDNQVENIGEMAANWVLKYVYQEPLKDIEHILKPRLINRSSVSTLIERFIYIR